MRKITKLLLHNKLIGRILSLSWFIAYCGVCRYSGEETAKRRRIEDEKRERSFLSYLTLIRFWFYGFDFYLSKAVYND
jgi:hypothetical protein